MSKSTSHYDLQIRSQQISLAKNELEVIFDNSNFPVLAVDQDRRIVRANLATGDWGLGSAAFVMGRHLEDILVRCRDIPADKFKAKLLIAWQEMLNSDESTLPVTDAGDFECNKVPIIRLQKIQSLTIRDGLVPRLFAICVLRTREDMLADVAIIDQISRRSQRRRLATDPHDRPIQHLIAAQHALMFEQSARRDKSRKTDMDTGLAHILTLIEHSIGLLRQVSQEENTVESGDFSMEIEVLKLFDSMEEFSGSADLSCSIFPAAINLPVTFAKNLLYIIREALLNALKNGFAEHVSVQLAVRADRLHLMISDDGIGFDADAALERGEGNGIEKIRDTVRAMNGSIKFFSSPGTGCVVSGCWNSRVARPIQGRITV